MKNDHEDDDELMASTVSGGLLRGGAMGRTPIGERNLYRRLSGEGFPWISLLFVAALFVAIFFLAR